MDLESRDFFRKLVRAKYHFNKLEEIVGEYTATDPYKVCHHVEGQPQVERWSLRITEQPPTDIAYILGEFLYNVRAGLDYLAAALVINEQSRDRCYYPILQRRVWEIPRGTKEEEQRLRAGRRSWEFVTANFDPAVVAIFQETHPPDKAPSRSEQMHPLRILQLLSNADRHRNLPVLTAGVAKESMRVKVTYAGGATQMLEPAPADGAGRGAFPDGAVIDTPPGVVNVEVTGPVVVVVPVGSEWSNVVIPGDMRLVWENACRIAGLLDQFA
jgi:hypothetical protein